MYPYATTTNQEYILQAINTTNTKIETLTNGIQATGLLIACIILIIEIKKLVIKCLGDHKSP